MPNVAPAGRVWPGLSSPHLYISRDPNVVGPWSVASIGMPASVGRLPLAVPTVRVPSDGNGKGVLTQLGARCQLSVPLSVTTTAWCSHHVFAVQSGVGLSHPKMVGTWSLHLRKYCGEM